MTKKTNLHLVHALLGVPVQECLALEHRRELVVHTLEQLLDASAVPDERHRHLEALGRDVALSAQHVVRDPLNEVGAVLVLYVLHLLLDLLHRDLAAEDGGDSEVAAVAGVAGGHHVLGIEHLLGELSDGDSTVLLRVLGGQGGIAGHEEVQTRERHYQRRSVRGNTTKLAEPNIPMLTASLRRSELSWPGKRRQVVIPDITTLTR
jgi:hypothetical protein